MDALPVGVQVYLASLLLGLGFPLLFFWMLVRPLKFFLASIFNAAEVERFWLRLILLVFLSSSLAVAVEYQPVKVGQTDFVALLWNFADQTRAILNGLLLGMLAVFLPLLLAYTVLHAGRGARQQRPAPGDDPPCPSS
jgi:hypothetical protein